MHTTAGSSENIVEAKSDFNEVINNKKQELARPIRFNVLIAGAAGLGKSSFIDAFITRKFEAGIVIREPTTSIQIHTGVRTEEGCSFEISMIDTPGYSAPNFSDYPDLLVGEIKNRFVEYRTQQEQRKTRRAILEDSSDSFKDNRIHCCLYFLNGPRISKQDSEVMQALQKYTSIIPIMARGDTYTEEEIRHFKRLILAQKEKARLDWFECQTYLQNRFSHKLQKLTNGPFGPAPPFVLVSCFSKIKINNRQVFVRKYKWGTCDMYNPDHCDFMLLYNFLLAYFSKPMIRMADTYGDACLKEEEQKAEKNNKEAEAAKEKNKIVQKSMIAVAVVAVGFLIYKIKS